MALVPDIVQYAGKQHIKRGHTIDRDKDKQHIKKHFEELGMNAEQIIESLDALAPACLCISRGVWWLTLIHPTKLCVLMDRIVYIHRFLWFKRLFRCERAVMIRHIREVECDVGIFSTNMVFRTHRSVEIFRVKKLYRKHARQTTRIIQALIHDELNHGSIPSASDFT
jgi:hypothetical protein